MENERVERRLAAILAADVVGYSRLMSTNEVGTLLALKTHRRETIDVQVAAHGGRIVKLLGDGVLVEFPSAVKAVECATNIQRDMLARNAQVPEDRRIEFRIGINLGDVILDQGDIYGDGVNVAARIESIARPGGVSVSAVVRDSVQGQPDLQFEDIGEQTLKNIDRPVRVFNVYLGVGSLQSDVIQAGEQAQVYAEAPTSGKPSIAVLPFLNMSNDPEQEFFADGITEDIITDLSKISALFVVGRNSVFTYKGKPVKLQDAARELGVRFLLEGSVRKAGQRVRVTAQLIDGRDGGHLWADRYDRELTDIFDVQDEITHTIVDQLKVKLLPFEMEAIDTAPTRNVEAYTHYLRGRQHFHLGTKTSLISARAMFTKAIELDPLYAQAYAGLADCDSRLKSKHGGTVSLEQILATLDRALSINPNLAEAHAARGFALMVVDRRADALASFEIALSLDDTCHEAHYHFADYCVTDGDFNGAARHYVRALELKPDDYISPVLLLNVLRSLGREREAEDYARLGVRRAEEALKLNPENSKPAQLGAAALATLGERERALELLGRALSIDPNDNSARYNAACVYSLLGEIDRAIDLLEIYLSEVGPDLKRWFKNDSDLDSIRGSLRYPALLELAG
ncbi:TPR end-of-group domain-containing protein [Ensifer sp. B1-9]|uniref:TPR end-of-group domain-containing protein n=1 Tax=Ensifer sp. B1-9 TaxID=3141455 RepID=UPI003D1B07EF